MVVQMDKQKFYPGGKTRKSPKFQVLSWKLDLSLSRYYHPIIGQDICSRTASAAACRGSHYRGHKENVTSTRNNVERSVIRLMSINTHLTETE